MKDTPIVLSLITLCAIAFLAEPAGGGDLVAQLALWPPGLFDTAGMLGASRFHVWQILTYAFLHGSFLHLFLNLYALWMFGVPLEQRWGPQRFALYFFACVVGAGLAHLAVSELEIARGGIAYPVVGASGGVFGLLLAFGLLYPNVRLMLLFPPVPIRALTFVIGYGVVELVAGITGTVSGVAHFAHLGGMLTGYLLLRGTAWLP